MKKSLAFALILAVAFVHLNAQDVAPESTTPPPRQTPEQLQERQTRRVQDAAAELKTMYDTNQDGVIDEQEHSKLDADLATAQRLLRYVMLAPVINEVDTDRNLEISAEEGAKIPEAMRKLRPQMGPGPGGRGPGMPGNGPRGPRGNRPNGPRGNRQGPPPQQDDAQEPPAPPTED